MVDNVNKKTRTEIMKAIKSSGSKIEIKVGKVLWQNGFRYRKNSQNYFGKPDFVLKKYKSVLFVDSCFWHGCKKHCRIPSTRKMYWINKIKNNTARDKSVLNHYTNNNWRVIRIWEHDLKDNLDKMVCAIITSLRG